MARGASAPAAQPLAACDRLCSRRTSWRSGAAAATDSLALLSPQARRPLFLLRQPRFMASPQRVDCQPAMPSALASHQLAPGPAPATQLLPLPLISPPLISPRTDHVAP